MSIQTSNAANLFLQNGTVWAIRTSAYTGTDRLNADDLGKRVDEIPDIFKLGSKHLFPNEVRIKLQAFRPKITALMNRVGRPFFLYGAYFVTNKNLLLAQEGIGKILEEQKAINEDIIEHLDEYKKEMVKKYPELENAKWPSPHQIRKTCQVHVDVFQVQGTTVSESDPEELIEAKRKFQANLDESYNELKQEILEQAHVAILEACDDIAQRLLSTGEKVTEATLKKPRRVIEEYMQVAAIFDLDTVKTEVARVRDLVESAKARTLRNNWGAAKEFAGQLKAIGESIGDLTGINRDGRLKRKVRQVQVDMPVGEAA